MSLKDNKPLDEAGIASKLGNMAVQGVKNARDRVLFGMGNDKARARLDLALVTKKLNKDWNYFATRKATAFQDKRILERPLVGDLQKFLASMYGWRLQAHQIKLILGGQGKSEEKSLPAPTKPPVVNEPSPKPKTPDEKRTDFLNNIGLNVKVKNSKITSPEEYATLQKTFGKRINPPTNTNINAVSNSPKKTADERAREAISKMSPQEYEALKRKYKNLANPENNLKSKLRSQMNQSMANESVILEDYDDEELNEPFDLKSFQRLADIMLDLGFFKIDRNGENIGGKDGSAESPDSDDSDGGETANARVTPDGHSIDINRMNKMMEADGIDAQKLAYLKGIVLKGKVTDIIQDGKASATMVSLINALLKSIASDNDRAARSITAQGSTIDINLFKENMEKLNVSGKQLNQIRQELGSGGEKAILTMLAKSGAGANVLFNLTKAVLSSIKKAAPIKKKA